MDLMKRRGRGAILEIIAWFGIIFYTKEVEHAVKWIGVCGVGFSMVYGTCRKFYSDYMVPCRARERGDWSMIFEF